MMHDEIYMAHALKLARRGRFTTMPNPNVGCVIVNNGKIIGEGYHLFPGEPHAEIHALHQAGNLARGATVYVTLEPCTHYGRTPPCCEALITAGVSRVVAAMKDPNFQVSGHGLYRLQQVGIKVSHGLMKKEAEKINQGFIKRMRLGLPWIQLKLAASLDGCTTISNYLKSNSDNQWITSAESRRDVQRFRAQSSAILSTSATVLADNPLLTVRYDELDSETQLYYPKDRLRQPIRIIIDSQNRVTLKHRVIHQLGETWLARAKCDSQKWPENVTQFSFPKNLNQLDLLSVIHFLGEKHINNLWVEAGARLAGSLIQLGIIDELIVYLAPRLLGRGENSLCDFSSFNKQHAADVASSFIFSDVSQVGSDIRLILIPA